MQAHDDQWMEPEAPRAGSPITAPDANPPLTALPGWILGLWVVTVIACIAGPAFTLIITLLGGVMGLAVGAVAILGPLGLFGAAVVLTLLAWQQIRENQR